MKKIKHEEIFFFFDNIFCYRNYFLNTFFIVTGDDLTSERLKTGSRHPYTDPATKFGGRTASDRTGPDRTGPADRSGPVRTGPRKSGQVAPLITNKPNNN